MAFYDAKLNPENRLGPPRYFSQVGSTLMAFIDRRVDTLRASLAETEVRSGESPLRHAAGQFRMVSTPASNAISDLFREVERSLGIEVGPQKNLRQLRVRIEFVLRFSRLVPCFDEFQFALPASYSRNTAPARLNWVRRPILDQKLSAVFICTPQSYHFTDLADEYLQLVVEAALSTERNYLSDISKIAKLAKDNARENGRSRPLLCDMPPIAAPVPLPCRAPASPLQRPRISPANLPESRRGMSPLAVKT